MSHIQSIIVVGAGIYGVTAALALRKRGYAVSLFDAGPLPHPNAASTDISKVIRMDYGGDELYLNMMEHAFVGWDQWNREWDERLYHQTGFVIMAREPMQHGTYEYESFTLLQRHGHQPQHLGPRELKRRFPAWNAERFVEGYFNPRAGWAESGKVVAHLLAEAIARGVALRDGAKFARLHESASRVAGIVTDDGETHRADFVVMCVGAWTPTALPQLSDVLWATGQPVLHFKVDDVKLFQPPQFSVWSADIANSGWYGFPALEDGTLKVANHGPGRRVHPDEPRVVDADAETRFRAFLRETFPRAADAPLLRTRLCLYCDSWDGNFWIDYDPEREGLVVCAGDSGHAFKFAPILGDLIADVLERKPNGFAPRFAWRARGTLEHEDARFVGAGQRK